MKFLIPMQLLAMTLVLASIAISLRDANHIEIMKIKVIENCKQLERRKQNGKSNTITKDI